MYQWVPAFFFLSSVFFHAFSCQFATVMHVTMLHYLYNCLMASSVRLIMSKHSLPRSLLHHYDSVAAPKLLRSRVQCRQFPRPLLIRRLVTAATLATLGVDALLGMLHDGVELGFTGTAAHTASNWHDAPVLSAM